MNPKKYSFVSWAHLLVVFALCINAGQSSSCGGILETAEGTLRYVSSEKSQLCVWVIKLPEPSTNIQFQTKEMPSGKLSLYPQKGPFIGQTTVQPMRANERSTLKIKSSIMVVVWSPSSGNGEDNAPLVFEWQGVRGQSFRDSNLVGGVGYVDGVEGEFLWNRAGKAQQTLLWVLNSQDSKNSVTLKTRAEFDDCDLDDVCQCSYLWVYQVYENSLRAVTTECGSSTQTFNNLRQPLIGLAFVDSEHQSGRNFVSISWKGKSGRGTGGSDRTETCSSGRPKSCAEIQNKGSGSKSSQTCPIYPLGRTEKPKEVLCDFKRDGGGWTIIQRRSSGPKEEFYRNWADYVKGFGSVDGNYWLGLKAIYALTKDDEQELRIDLWDFEGGHAYTKYSSFSISDADDFYRLSISGYSGTAGDMTAVYDPNFNPNGMRFTTKDKDNDNYPDGNCAVLRTGAWWYNSCFSANLNGPYYEKGERQSDIYSGMIYYPWKNSWRSLRKVEMKIRPRR